MKIKINMYKELFYLAIGVIIIDLFIIYFTPKYCPHILIANYLKAIIIQGLILIVIAKHDFVKKLTKAIKLNIGNLYLILFSFMLGSFYMFWVGTMGQYVFGGQRYCHIHEIPNNFIKYL